MIWQKSDANEEYLLHGTEFISFDLGFLWVTAITPGPNFGFMRSLWLMIGILLGMQSILLLVAFGVGSLLLVYPSLHLHPENPWQLVPAVAGVESCLCRL